jgi:hypothetical protein
MSYELFVLSLIGLCIASIAAFISAFKSRSYLLGVFVPLIALCGSFIYFSYTSVLGYPAQMEWRDLPEMISVIYFRVIGKETITLWIIDKGTTRLVRLPYSKSAENGLEGERKTMGQGIPVTFKKGGNGKGQGEGIPGTGIRGVGEGDTSGVRGHGWEYRVKSRGDPIPDGSLPPK